jgi:lipid A 4'-phosphatase
MWMVDPYTPEEIRFRRAFITATCAIGAAAAALFIAFPSIDMEISHQLRLCSDTIRSGPWCSDDPGVELLRDMFVGLTAIIGIAIAVGLVRTLRERGKIFGLAQARWWFLIAVLAVGPGLVANVVLKDNWGRARPRSVVEFGGTKHFTPALIPASECARNCSFVSGEASSAFVPFFAAALLLPQFRRVLFGAGLATGLAAGLIRISQGGHFLSDILFAGVFMALTASALHILLIGLWQKRTLDDVLAPYVRPLQEAWLSAAWPRVASLLSIQNQARP